MHHSTARPCSYEEFLRANSCLERFQIICRQGWAAGLDATYDENKGCVEIDVSSFDEPTRQALFNSGARPVGLLPQMWAFPSVQDFYAYAAH